MLPKEQMALFRSEVVCKGVVYGRYYIQGIQILLMALCRNDTVSAGTYTWYCLRRCCMRRDWSRGWSWGWSVLERWAMLIHCCLHGAGNLEKMVY